MKIIVSFFIVLSISSSIFAQSEDCFFLFIASTEREIQTESTQGSQDIDCGFGSNMRPSITYNDYHETKTSNNDTVTCLNYLKRSILWVSESPEYLNTQLKQSKLNSQLYYSGKICGSSIENDLLRQTHNTYGYSLEELLKTNISFPQNYLPLAIHSGSELSWAIPNLNVECKCKVEDQGTLQCTIQAQDAFKK